MTIGVLLALKADKPATDVVDAFLRAARYLRALPGNIADNAKIILAVALEATVKEYEGKHASRLLGIERNFLRRAP